MHSSMRWAHTLTCMRSRRWGREGSNGRIQSAQLHRGCTCLHTDHAVLPAWGSFTITARVLSSSHNSRDSLLHPYCPRVALTVAAYIPLAHDFLSLPCEYREMLTIPHIFSSQTIADGLHHKETQLLLG